ncbi:MAG: PD-(D/E)XK nuclease-like domain-containing protein [Rhodospirillales bacterium]
MTNIDYEMPDYEYHDKKKHPHISSSDVKTVYGKSLLHWVGQEYKESPTLEMGKAVHSLILEYEKQAVVRGPSDRRGNKWKEAKQQAEKEGKIILTERDYDTALEIAESALFNSEFLRSRVSAKNFISEASIFTTCKKTGMLIKCRPDGLLVPQDDKGKGEILDIKTTQDASPEGFQRELRKYNYDLQIAFYLHTMRCASLPCSEMYLVAIEKTPPYAVGVHVLSEIYIKHAEKRMIQTLEKMKHAESSQDFSTGWPEINQVHLPAWLEDDMDDAAF